MTSAIHCVVTQGRGSGAKDHVAPTLLREIPDSNSSPAMRCQ